MKRSIMALAAMSLISSVSAQTFPVGARIYQSIDTEHNTVTKVMGEFWRDGKNSQDGVVVDSKMQSYYSDNDLRVGTVGRPLLEITTTSSEKAGAYYNFPKPISLQNRSIRFRVRASDWKQVKDMNLILSTGNDKFERSLTLDLTTKLQLF